MANMPHENLMSELASQMISQIGSFFERISASPNRPIGGFAGETAQNILYVLYSANGLPLCAGVILASDGKRGEARAQKEVQALAGSGYVASYRTVEFGSEIMAAQMERLVTDLFGAALPLSAGATRGSSPEAAPVVRAGRPRRNAAAAGAQSSGRRRGRPRKNADAAEESGEAAAPRRRGRPRRNDAEGAAAAPRRRGRPRKTEEVETAPARRPPGRPRKDANAEAAPARRRGRPRKVETGEAAAPRRRGRPRKEGSTGATGRRRGGRKGGNAEGGAGEGE